jgi:hypothetical protein
MQEALAAIHQANRRRLPIMLEYGAHDGKVGLYCRVPDELSSLVVSLLTAKYPNCSVQTLDNDAALEPPLTTLVETWSARLRLVPDLFPILRHSQFEDIQGEGFTDPIDALLQSVQADEQTHARIEIEVVPVTRWRQYWARRAVTVLDDGFFRAGELRSLWFARVVMHPLWWPLGWLVGFRVKKPLERMQRFQIETTGGRHHEREDDVQAASDKVGGHLFETRIQLTVYGPRHGGRAASHRLRQMFGAFGAFTVSRLATFRPSRVRCDAVRSMGGRCFLMSHEELATLWHLPMASVGVGQLHTTDFMELPAPIRFNAKENEGATLGRVQCREDLRTVVLAPDDRRRHVYIVGKTGMGKTTLLGNQINADIHAGRGVALIDPHGDLADRVVSAVPPNRTNDVIVFDPSDNEYVVAYNPLACAEPDKRDLVADDVLSAFSKVYDLSQTPRLKDTLRNALYVLIEKDMTLLNLLVFFGDERFRRDAVAGIEDDVARLFWEIEFPSWNSRYRTEALSAVQNKVRPFLMNKRVRAIVGQRRNPLNLRRVMDEGKVVIVNLSKGKLGEDNSALLGALLVSSIQQAAMSRADVPEEQRRDFYLFVDEFQNFATDAFATILSEARKYRLNLTVAHQYLGQLTQKRGGKQDFGLRDAVFGNVGSTISFQVGSSDAETIAEQLAKYPGQLAARDVANLPRYKAYARLQINGQSSNPFSMQTLAPPASQQDRFAAVRDVSRRQHAQPLETVQQHLRKELAFR